MSRVPFRHRFRFGWEHQGWRFSLRIVCGLVVIYAARKWPEWNTLRFESALQIGFIRLSIEGGQTVPCWTIYKRTIDMPPERFME